MNRAALIERLEEARRWLRVHVKTRSYKEPHRLQYKRVLSVLRRARRCPNCRGIGRFNLPEICVTESGDMHGAIKCLQCNGTGRLK